MVASGLPLPERRRPRLRLRLEAADTWNGPTPMPIRQMMIEADRWPGISGASGATYRYCPTASGARQMSAASFLPLRSAYNSANVNGAAKATL